VAADPRNRSIKAHISGESKPKVIEWASRKQQAAFEYGPLPLCVSGGFGAAKTWALCLKALWLSDVFPNNRGIIARRIWSELQTTTMSTFFKICPPEAYRLGKRSDSEKYLRLNNGSEILWMHMDSEDALGVIRGVEINWFIMDQAEEIKEEVYDLLMSRLGRWDKATVPEWMLEAEMKKGIPWAWTNPGTGAAIVPTYPMIACNPDTELHWIYRRFHPESPDWEDKYCHEGYTMIQMDSRDNKFLPKQNLDLMLAKDESFVRRFVEGKWGIPEGQIHEVSPLSIVRGTPDILDYLRQRCTLHRTLDHGDASPTCCIWWAVDKEGNIFAYREYYMPNRLVSNHREEITALSEGERYQFQLADPSIFHKLSQKNGGRWSVADEYSDVKGLPRRTAIHWQAADNNELGTRNRINEYLRVDKERIHPITKEKGSPRLFFIEGNSEYPNGCRNLIRETKSQRRVKVGTDLGRPVFCDDRDETLSDHSYDCLRYFLSSRPPAQVEMPAQYGRWTWRKRHQDLMKFQKRGGWRKLAKRAEAVA